MVADPSSGELAGDHGEPNAERSHRPAAATAAAAAYRRSVLARRCRGGRGRRVRTDEVPVRLQALLGAVLGAGEAEPSLVGSCGRVGHHCRDEEGGALPGLAEEERPAGERRRGGALRLRGVLRRGPPPPRRRAGGAAAAPAEELRVADEQGADVGQRGAHRRRDLPGRLHRRPRHPAGGATAKEGQEGHLLGEQRPGLCKQPGVLRRGKVAAPPI